MLKMDKSIETLKNFTSSGGTLKFELNKTNEDIRNLSSKIKDVENLLSELNNKINDLSLDLKSRNELEFNVKKEQIEKDIKVENELNASVEEDPGKYYNVEYFVESGVIKFRETDSGSPFYMQQFKNRSELTLDEKAYASTYSEAIEKCFYVRGNKSGNYKNLKPGKCEYDTYANTWKLVEQGEVEGK